MLYKAGRILARTLEGTDNINSILHIFKPTSFSFASEVTEITSEGFSYDVNPIQILDSAISREEFTLTIPQTSTDNLDLQMFVDQREATITSISIPTDEKITVPSTGPYTVTVAGLAGTADQDVVAVVLSDTGPKYLKRVLSSATPAAGEFEINITDEITFNAAQAGATVVIWYNKTETSLVAIGGTAPRSQYGVMSFSAVIEGPRVKKQLFIPRLSRTSGASLGVAADATETSLTYKATTPSGWSVPFLLRTVA